MLQFRAVTRLRAAKSFLLEGVRLFGSIGALTGTAA
jgi:hypothetical protein